MSIDSANPSPRQRRSPEAARENILGAAQDILVEAGPQNLKLAEVARAAGISNATVLHYFGTIADLQTALMTRMIETLVQRILEISARTEDHGKMAGESTAALFEAFEARGVARLAAWLELTGEARRLTHVREAVQNVIAARTDQPSGLPPEVLEDFILTNISIALGVGLFGATLSALLDKPETRARDLALALLHSRIADTMAAFGGEP